MLKRFMVAWFLLSWFLIPMYMGLPYHTINMTFFNALIFRECLNLVRHPKKHRVVSVPMEWFIYVTYHYMYMPKYVLTKPVLVASGLSVDKYPLLHAFLYDYQV